MLYVIKSNIKALFCHCLGGPAVAVATAVSEVSVLIPGSNLMLQIIINMVLNYPTTWL